MRNNFFIGRGNLGSKPELKYVGDDKKPVLNLSVYFERKIKNDDGEYEDKGGFWRNINYWGGKKAEHISTILTK